MMSIFLTTLTISPLTLAELVAPELVAPDWAEPIITVVISAVITGTINFLFKKGMTTAKDAMIAGLQSLVAENKLSAQTSTTAQTLINQTEVKLLKNVDELTATVSAQGGIISEFVEGARTQSTMVGRVLTFLDEYDDEITEIAGAFLATDEPVSPDGE